MYLAMCACTKIFARINKLVCEISGTLILIIKEKVIFNLIMENLAHTDNKILLVAKQYICIEQDTLEKHSF